MPYLILLRHGQSKWNFENRFTGWVDIPLSLQGVLEAQKAGQLIKNLPVDVIFTSRLFRAQMTVMLAMMDHSSGRTPCLISSDPKAKTWSHIYDEKAKESLIEVHTAWELNERYYGELQGLNKQETIDKYGKELVHTWRRSYDVPPPSGESLAMTAARTQPYFKEKIEPHLQAGKNVFIAAHGNSLRSIIMKLENLSSDQVLNLELSTGEPLIFLCQKQDKGLSYKRVS